MEFRNQSRLEASMENSEAQLVKRHQLIYGSFFLFAVLLLVLAHFVFAKDSFLQVMCKELGTAGLVSFFLIFTIEQFTRERHSAAANEQMIQINRNLFNAVFRRYIPERVFEEVEKCVMESKVYRTGHELDYSIDIFPTDVDKELQSNHFQCTAQTRYCLENVLDQEIDHDVRLVIERPLKSAFDAYCKVTEVQVGSKNLNAGEIASFMQPATTAHFIFSMPIKISPKGKVTVATKATLVKQKSDSENWCSRLPSNGLTLTVSTPSKGIDVKAHANHSEPFELRLDNKATKKWVLDFGIFPFQSVIIWWKPLDS